MDLGSTLLFAAIIAVANATPGPTILTLIARVLGMGPARNVGFAIGLVLGDVLWLAAAVFGLAALATQAHQLKGTAGGYGFPVITEAAAALEACVRARATATAIHEHIVRVAAVCRRARASRANE